MQQQDVYKRQVVNRMQGNFGADRDAYLKMLMRPELLILDDLGAERNTSLDVYKRQDVPDAHRLVLPCVYRPG